MYFGITCHESVPHGVLATQLRRDVSQEFDDYFEIVIDSRRDRRTAATIEPGGNLTGNTDFADSDVDVQQFNLTPYKLFFPEKRHFFLGNASVFSVPLSIESGDHLFFSRQVGIDPVTGQEVPISGGARITGSLGGLELGVMDVDTRSSGPNPYANCAVVRVKRSIGESGSYLGAIGIEKRSGNRFILE